MFPHIMNVKVTCSIYGIPIVCFCKAEQCLNFDFDKHICLCFSYRMLYTECTPQTCPCGEQCANQRIQKQTTAHGLEKIQTPDRGFGVKTTNLICSGKHFIPVMLNVRIDFYYIISIWPGSLLS